MIDDDLIFLFYFRVFGVFFVFFFRGEVRVLLVVVCGVGWFVLFFFLVFGFVVYISLFFESKINI